MVPRGGRFLAIGPEPLPLPPWLTQDDLNFYGAEFARTGFRGGLNWYRNIDRNWELLSASMARSSRFLRSTSQVTATWSWRSPALSSSSRA
jgi:hypothetical protein